MRIDRFALSAAATAVSLCGPAALLAQAPAATAERQPGGSQASTRPSSEPSKGDDAVRRLISRLDLEKYKTTIAGLAQFGDRRQGTERNRRAVDWIEAQLRSYGCPTERVRYLYDPPPRPPRPPETRRPAVIASGEVRSGAGGSRLRGIVGPTGVNTDPAAQPDPRLRALDAEPAANGPREQVFCTKVGTEHPDEMYLVAAHMDGLGFAEAANDDGSGTALVMELARVFSLPDVRTERSVRFVLWNNEETGLDGAKAYVEQRASLQGREDPPGSRRYPEPRWLAMVQHDMMLWDHGMPRADGTQNPRQRPEADVNIEFQSRALRADEAMKLAFFFQAANEKFAADYPATVGAHMTNTDSTPFMDVVPAISLRENERGLHVGAGWDPTWHQPSDVYTTFSDEDFRLGLNAAQTTSGAIGLLAGARLVD